MNRIFQRLPLPQKLLLLALLPLAFLVFLAIDLYNEKSKSANLTASYVHQINISISLSNLINQLQEERRLSFDYSITPVASPALYQIRKEVDSSLEVLGKYNDPMLKNFPAYTNLKALKDTRTSLDSGKLKGRVIHYYSATIFRINTLNSIPIGSSQTDSLLYDELISQKLLSEMITYGGIISANIYNVLITKAYIPETLMGTHGTYEVFKSYGDEFLIKAPAEHKEDFQKLIREGSFATTRNYIDTVFARYSLGNQFEAVQWRDISFQGFNELRGLQQNIWNSVKEKLNGLREEQSRERKTTLFLIILFFVLISLLFLLILKALNKSLKQLKTAAHSLAVGENGIGIPPLSNDSIGSLAKSIQEIDINNQKLTEAALAIGQGNFSMPVIPRSEDDKLGKAIQHMQEELKGYRDEMESIVEERTEALTRSNQDLQQFAHVASHDLKEPLRKISVFSSRLIDGDEELKDETRGYISKIQLASERMMAMVDGILNYSGVSGHNEDLTLVDLNSVLNDIKEDLELQIDQKQAVIKSGSLPKVAGYKTLLHQLFYNLINNSLKFSKPGVPPVIEIESRIQNEKQGKGEKGFVVILVKDNGIGFSQQYASRVFDLFSRLQNKSQFEGTGLGLALCKKIAERHSGSITVESKEGEGTVFYLALPMSDRGLRASR